DFRRFTHLVAMDHDNLANLRRLAPPDATAELSLLLDHVEGRAGQAVADPYFGEDDDFDVTWANVTAGARALAAKLQRRRG
ncbi:arsenate reductase/protein-tyrosine-phosphatase family protein, partial [Klebsiella quasipneumoniae]